jgi:hypothetical protein
VQRRTFIGVMMGALASPLNASAQQQMIGKR